MASTYNRWKLVRIFCQSYSNIYLFWNGINVSCVFINETNVYDRLSHVYINRTLKASTNNHKKSVWKLLRMFCQVYSIICFCFCMGSLCNAYFMWDKCCSDCHICVYMWNMNGKYKYWMKVCLKTIAKQECFDKFTVTFTCFHMGSLCQMYL